MRSVYALNESLMWFEILHKYYSFFYEMEKNLLKFDLTSGNAVSRLIKTMNIKGPV